jgi:23S rRNA (pseudouridine1915-N3)-methyltransferase
MVSFVSRWPVWLFSLLSVAIIIRQNEVRAFVPTTTTTTTTFLSTTKSHRQLAKYAMSYRSKKLSSSSLFMGMKVNIRIVGRKSSEPWLEEGCAMYETRLLPSNVEVETTWHKDNAALIKGVEGDRSKGHSIVLLDPTGVTKSSDRFADDVYEWLDVGGSRLSFVIGGAEGLPPELKYPLQGSKPVMISLSALTFTHQFARMLLIEQIYRATEIRKGSGYHK